MENNSKIHNSCNMYNEINYSELIDNGRKLVNESGQNLGEYHITLALLAPNLDLQSKIQAWAIKSYAYYKIKDENILLTYIKRIFKILNTTKVRLLEQYTVFSMIRILYRGGMLMSECKHNFISGMLLYKAKLLFEDKDIRGEQESFETLEKSFNDILKKITVEV